MIHRYPIHFPAKFTVWNNFDEILFASLEINIANKIHKYSSSFADLLTENRDDV